MVTVVITDETLGTADGKVSPTLLFGSVYISGMLLNASGPGLGWKNLLRPANVAVVATPILKLWPVKLEESMP